MFQRATRVSQHESFMNSYLMCQTVIVGEVRVDIHHEDSAAAKSSLTIKQQVAFLIPFLETVFGILMYKRLKPIVLIEGRKAFSSWTNFRAALQNRYVLQPSKQKLLLKEQELYISLF